MAKITAAQVNELRRITGAGMMDCKKALVEADGDKEKAMEILRKKGQKIANKRADKEATEGIVIAKTSGDTKRAAILKINCETDFVAKNDEFVDFANKVIDLALEKKMENKEDIVNAQLNGKAVKDIITDLMGKIGEKIELSNYDYLSDEKTVAYNHQGNKLAAIVSFNKADVENIDEIGREIAMQIAAMNPAGVDKDDVPKNVVEKELEIGKEQALKESKPENIVDKIAQGKLNKFFKESTLLNQEFVRDTKKTVSQYLKEADKDLTVNSFRRMQLGE